MKVLDQESGDYAVSKQAVLDLISDYCLSRRIIIGGINALPPVTRQPKKGHWIKHDTGHSIYYDCSLCGCVAPCTETADKILWKMANYCPDCGAKMFKEKED